MNDASQDRPEAWAKIDAAFERFQGALEADDFAAARAALDDAAQAGGDDDPEVRFAEATLRWEEEGPDAARRALRALVEDEPEYADAWYALGGAADALDDVALRTEAWLMTRRLDAADDASFADIGEDVVDRIERVAREVLAGLPDEFAERLAKVPVVLDERPSEDLVRDGLDPRAYGLFDGQPYGEDPAPVPTRIVLFTSNLGGSYEHETLEREVEITVLHEVGHYFGLDEDEVAALGLA